VKILIIHGLRFDSRLTTFQHTLSFARHLSGCEVYYVNGLGLTSSPILDQEFDLAVVTYELVALRNTPFWKYISSRIKPLMQRARVRAVMPQDDYSSCQYLDDFVVKYDVQYVFSPLTRDLHMLYPQSIAKGVEFFEAFTGYWEASTALPYQKLRKPFNERSVDLGQRVRHLPPQLGPAAQRKGELAIEFANVAESAGFTCDVSTRDQDVLIGTDWWRFLGDIRFTVGRLGGASIADPKGLLAIKVNQLQLRHRGITFDDIARRLRTKDLPQGDFSAISPRLFECAAMGVCQILERSHYFDDFEPWKHYVPLNPDLSNTDEVLEVMRDHKTCATIAAEAEKSLIQSGRHTYSEFVRRLLRTTTGHNISDDDPDVEVHDVDEPLFDGLSSQDAEKSKRAARRMLTWTRKSTRNEMNDNALVWVNSFRDDSLCVESMTLPWSPAVRHLQNT
jgi:hypothetical protein